MISKIKSITFQNSWTGQYGEMFTSLYELEDGSIGEANSKSKDAWNVGDEVDYAIVGKAPNGNNKFKLKRPDSDFKQSSGGVSTNYADKDKDIRAGMISNQIVHLVGAGTFQSIASVTDGQIEELIKLNERVKAKL